MILYKYYPCDENTFKSLSVGGLWCHRADMMNDPFECLAGADCQYSAEELKLFRKALAKHGEVQLDKSAGKLSVQTILDMSDVALSDFINKLRRALIERNAFCSLSEKGDDILMWSHYANGHKGCAIGIEFPDDLEDIHLQKVSYSDEPINLDLERLADMLTGSEESENLSQFLASMSVKGKAWEGEREWRIWRKEPRYWGYDKAKIKHLYFGPKCPEDTILIVLKLLDLPEDFKFNIVELKYSPLRLVP